MKVGCNKYAQKSGLQSQRVSKEDRKVTWTTWSPAESDGSVFYTHIMTPDEITLTRSSEFQFLSALRIFTKTLCRLLLPGNQHVKGSLWADRIPDQNYAGQKKNFWGPRWRTWQPHTQPAPAFNKEATDLASSTEAWCQGPKCLSDDWKVLKQNPHE